jgi:hypothetical protein
VVDEPHQSHGDLPAIRFVILFGEVREIELRLIGTVHDDAHDPVWMSHSQPAVRVVGLFFILGPPPVLQIPSSHLSPSYGVGSHL